MKVKIELAEQAVPATHQKRIDELRAGELFIWETGSPTPPMYMMLTTSGIIKDPSRDHSPEYNVPTLYVASGNTRRSPGRGQVAWHKPDTLVYPVTEAELKAHYITNRST